VRGMDVVRKNPGVGRERRDPDTGGRHQPGATPVASIC
jgi:hypothetical protein